MRLGSMVSWRRSSPVAALMMRTWSPSTSLRTPPYHFVQLALGTIGASEGGSPVVHAAAVLGFTLLFLVVAVWGFRRDEGRTYG